MLFRKLWRTMGLYKAQFISMIIMLALGTGIFVGFNMEWVSIEKNVASFFKKTGFADYRILSETGFTGEQLEKITRIEGVDRAARYLSVHVDVLEKEGDSLALTVTENEQVSGFLLMNGADYDPESKDGIWLSDQYAASNGIQLGDSLTLTYKDLAFKGTVQGLIKSAEHMICVRDESQLMPDYSTFGYAYISAAMYAQTVGTVFYPQIHAVSGMDKKDFTEAVDQTLGNTMLILSKDETISYAGAMGEAEEGQTMGSVLPVLFLLIAVLTMVTTMHRLAAKEKIQIGTLKALGYRNKRILRHYTSYAFMIGMIGCGIGTGLGYGVAWYIMNPNGMMGTYLDMPEWRLYLPWFCWVVLILILLLLTLIGYLSVRQMLRGTAADALRPYTPKKMRALFVERSKLFHRLSFGPRWNMRDIMRHKSRTAMSLIGIVGCMMIIVCALGMRDTMNAFLDMYYDGALNYASRIYIAENTGDEQRADLAARYRGDWSASVSVQMEEKAVSLDVYKIEYGKVRFPGRDARYVNIGDDGAYICMRIADQFGLRTGDTITVSPYGSDQQYTLKVAGLIRSVSENIVISPAYAKILDIPYMIDSVYTDAAKADILPEDTIKSVQSKQMIMDSFDTFTDLMDTMIYILVLGAMLLGVVVLYNLGVMSYTERYREMATLKVVGFKNKKIGKLLIGQNLWLTLAGVAIGLPLGIGVLDYLLKALASEYEMKLSLGPATYGLSVLLTFGVSLLVSLMVARKNKKIDMVEALKGAE